ncbi:MAG: hypothetical protein ACKVK6_12580, partial [bacterium]
QVVPRAVFTRPASVAHPPVPVYLYPLSLRHERDQVSDIPSHCSTVNEAGQILQIDGFFGEVPAMEA